MKKLSLLLVLALTGFTSSTSCFFWKPKSNIQVKDYDKSRDHEYVVAEFVKNSKDLASELDGVNDAYPIDWITNFLYDAEHYPEAFGIKILYVENQPVGFIIYLRKQPEIDDLLYPQKDGVVRPKPDINERLLNTANILFIAINKAHQGNHYAEILLKQAFKDLQTNGIKHALLLTESTNNNSQRLWQRLGFKAIAHCPKYLYYVMRIAR